MPNGNRLTGPKGQIIQGPAEGVGVSGKSFLPAIGLGLQAFSGIISSLAIRDTARLNAFIAGKNAELKEIEARIAKKESDIAVALTKRKGKKLLSAQQAAIGMTGLTAESFEKVVEETIMDTELEAAAVRFRGIVREGDILAQAGRERGEAAIQRGKARRAGFQSLLKGLGSGIEITQELKKQGIT